MSDIEHSPQQPQLQASNTFIAIPPCICPNHFLWPPPPAVPFSSIIPIHICTERAATESTSTRARRYIEFHSSDWFAAASAIDGTLAYEMDPIHEHLEYKVITKIRYMKPLVRLLLKLCRGVWFSIAHALLISCTLRGYSSQKFRACLLAARNLLFLCLFCFVICVTWVLWCTAQISISILWLNFIEHIFMPEVVAMDELALEAVPARSNRRSTFISLSKLENRCIHDSEVENGSTHSTYLYSLSQCVGEKWMCLLQLWVPLAEK